MDLLTLGLINKMRNSSGNNEGGGSGSGIVFVTLDENNKSSMTAGEICEAMENGSYVIARCGHVGDWGFYPLRVAIATSETGYYRASFSQANDEDGEIPAVDIIDIGNTYDSDTATWTRVVS